MTQQNKNHGCSEYEQLARRGFINHVGRIGALAAVTAPAWMPKMSFAQSENTSRDLIVSIFLRGGADGLSLVPPVGDRDYYRWRSRLGVPAPDDSSNRKSIDLDGYFALHPALEPLKPFYDDQSLAIVHATGSPDPSRSHFEAQDFMEMGTPGLNTTLTGWLGRHLASIGEEDIAQIYALAASYTIQRTLAGAPKSVAIPSIEEYGVYWRDETLSARNEIIERLYRDANDSLTNYATDINNSLDLVQQLQRESYTPAGGANYPEGEWGEGLKTIARLAKADVGLQGACIDLGGWDTHADQGTLDGELNSLADQLARGLAAFATDMDDRKNRLTVVVVSEFGRTVAENGSAGTDHGHGNAMLVYGGGINGGQVIADWPTLANDQLDEEGDLRITTDYRDVLAEILEKRGGNTNLNALFPNHQTSPVGITM